MEKGKKIVEKIVTQAVNFYVTNLVFQNEEKFDDDFRQVLQLFYFLGFTTPRLLRNESPMEL